MTTPPATGGLRKELAADGFLLRGPSTPLPGLLTSLWSSRGLLSVLARKDFFVRYRRTSLGLFWAVGLPLVQVGVLAVVFTRIGHFGRTVSAAHGVSYIVFLYAGMLAWTYFSQTVTAASTAVADNSGLASKIYFPRALLPLLTVVTGLYPLAISLVLLTIVVAAFGALGPAFPWVIPALALLVAETVALGLMLSALHVYFRDVRYLVQAALSVLFYVTPVFYPASIAPARLRTLVELLPVAGPVELMRLAVGAADPGWPTAVVAGVVWAVVAGVVGLWLHSRFDRVFVDLL